jgi:hypothetical protein
VGQGDVLGALGDARQGVAIGLAKAKNDGLDEEGVALGAAEDSGLKL